MNAILFALKYQTGAGVATVETFTSREAAMRAFESVKNNWRYTLVALTPRTRRSQGAERFLVEKDRARGASSHLKGIRSKEWRGEKVVCGVVETRIA